MYETYFDLKTKPFELVPNPDFVFLSRAHKKVLTYLDYGIRERAGFILLTGEVGAGKTTIIRDLIRKLAPETVLARIFNTRVTSSQLIAMINEEFGIASCARGRVELIKDLNDFLIEQYARGKRPLLIIDEAQNLTAELLEEIRMLSNLETDDSKLLQIILVGQPELRSTLAGDDMRQLRQRISINCHLTPMSRAETEQYILHRLEVAGNRDAAGYTAEAFDLVYTFSRGVPRLVNIICDFLMLSAFAEETRTIDGAMVRDIAGDLDFERHYWGDEAPAEAGTAEGTTYERTEEAQGPEAGSLALLTEIRGRLDGLERKILRHEEHLVSEIAEKLLSLENAFRFHVQETETSVDELTRKLVRIDRSQADNGSGDAAKAVRPGLVNRIFGK